MVTACSASSSSAMTGRPRTAASRSASSSGPITAAVRSSSPAGPSSSQRADTDSTSDAGSSVPAACWASSVRNSGCPFDRAYSSSTRPDPTSSAAASRPSASRWTNAVAGSGSPSPDRIAATTVTAMSSRRTNRSQSASAWPARCASSTTTTSGARSVRRPSARTRAEYSTAGPSMLSASIGGGRGPGVMFSNGARIAASAPRTSALTPGSSSRSWAASAASSASSGSERSSGPHDAISTVSPAATRRSAQARSNVVFPMPASPSTTATSAEPPRARVAMASR